MIIQSSLLCGRRAGSNKQTLSKLLRLLFIEGSPDLSNPVHNDKLSIGKYFTHFLLAIAYQFSVNRANSKHSACKVISMINFIQLYLCIYKLIPVKHEMHAQCNADRVRYSPVKHDQYISDNLCNRDIHLDKLRLAHIIPNAFLLHFPHYLGARAHTQEISKNSRLKNCVASAREMHNEPCSSPQGGDAPTGCSLLHLY